MVGWATSRSRWYFALATMPTISITRVGNCSLKPTIVKVLPTGFSPLKYFFANASLTMMTCGEPRAIGVGDVAPGQQRRPHRPEVVRRHAVEQHAAPLVGGVVRAR